MIKLQNINWWLIVLGNLIGYFLYRFGSSKNGILSPLVEFIGGSILVVTFMVMWFQFGFIAVIGLIIIFMFPITIICEIMFFKGKLIKRQDDHISDKKI